MNEVCDVEFVSSVACHVDMSHVASIFAALEKSIALHLLQDPQVSPHCVETGGTHASLTRPFSTGGAILRDGRNPLSNCALGSEEKRSQSLRGKFSGEMSEMQQSLLWATSGT